MLDSLLEALLELFGDALAEAVIAGVLKLGRAVWEVIRYL